MRAVAAVAVAGVILGAAGGAVTTALVSDGHGDRGDHLRIGHQIGGPGTPMLPPDGRQRLPGDDSEDGEMPEMPAPPRSEGGTDGGTDEAQDLSRS